MTKPKVLIAVNDSAMFSAIRGIEAFNAIEAIELRGSMNWIDEIKQSEPDIAIVQADQFSELQLEALADGQLLESTETIFVSEGAPNASIDQAMMCGVSYHLRTPLDLAFLDDLLLELGEEIALQDQNTADALTSNLDQFGLLLGSSRPMRKLFRIIRKSATSPATIFLVGESGSGKELVANTIHLLSDRKDNPIMTLNCGAISPELIESELFGHVKGAFTGASAERSGVFEQADGSTLFLDEVTEMPLDQQVKLLRVLETGEYRKVGSDQPQYCDVRVISATNREPSRAVSEELFREDLYFRLAQFPIRVPPLRERQDDIIGLAHHFLAYRNSEEATSVTMSPDALTKLREYAWPGNVRDLKHTVERAYILANDVIEAEHVVLDTSINDTMSDGLPTDVSLEEVEKHVILKTLEENAGKKNETAKILGISVKTLYNKLERYRSESEPER